PQVGRAAPSAPHNNMTVLGVYGGAMNSMTLDGDLAYIGQGALVAIVDISNPTQPARIGQSTLLPALVTAIAVSQGYAYAALGTAGLAVVDVQDPANPVLVGVLDTPGSATDLLVVGSALWVADGDAGLQAFDLSDPA